jgi:hypothetical protein
MTLPIQGIDPNDMNALAEVMPTLDAHYFIFPFLAHALGTLGAAFIAYKIAATHKMKFSIRNRSLLFISRNYNDLCFLYRHGLQLLI